MYFQRVISIVLSPVTAPINYFLREPKKVDLLKDREEFLNTPFVSTSKKPVAKEVISKDFIGTVKTTANGREEEKYLESYIRKGKDFTAELIGISDAIAMNENFSCSSAFEKGEYSISNKDLPSVDMLDGYFLKVVSKGQKAGFIIGTDREGLNTAKKMLDELSTKLADDTHNPEDDASVTTFDKAIQWFKNSDYSTRGSTNNRGRLVLVN